MIFDSFNIFTRDLAIDATFHVHRGALGQDGADYDNNWDRRLVSFLNRIAELGHLEENSPSQRSIQSLFLKNYQPLLKHFVGVMKGNRDLSLIDLGFCLFVCLMTNGRPTCKAYKRPWRATIRWARLWWISIHRRTLPVCGWHRIDKLYALHRLYTGSARLMQDDYSTSARSLLVGKAWVGQQRIRKLSAHCAIAIQPRGRIV